MPTGFAEVTRNICSRLSSRGRYEVFVYGENYSGSVFDFMGFKVLGRKKNESEIKGLVRIISEIKPDVLITLEDSFTLFNQGFYKLQLDFPWIGYFPMDGDMVPTGGKPILRNCTKIVAMSKFTQEVMKNAGFDSELIYHGVDLYDFRPANSNEKSYLRTKYGFDENDIIATVIARNSMRKRNHRLLEAMVKACIKNPKLKFFCHIMNYKSHDLNCEDFVMNVLKDKYGIDAIKEGKIIFNPKGIDPLQRVTDNEISEYIKMADFTVSGSSGEGFGMLQTNSMACGIPCVQTDYTTTHELLIDTDCGFGIRGLGVKYNGLDTSSYNVEHAYCDIDDLTEKILWLADNLNEAKGMGYNGRQFVEEFCNWNKLTDKWEKVIGDVI